MRRVKVGIRRETIFQGEKKKRPSRIMKNETGLIKSTKKQKGDEEKSGEECTTLNNSFLGEQEPKVQPQGKPGSSGDNGLAVPPTEEAYSSQNP
jgi:hypothetical protein